MSAIRLPKKTLARLRDAARRAIEDARTSYPNRSDYDWRVRSALASFSGAAEVILGPELGAILSSLDSAQKTWSEISDADPGDEHREAA